jgi:phosphoglycolate phosphatase-like HAD superfamily hydrolase
MGYIMISFKNKKVIVFDLDGTIVNLAVDWQELKRILSERYSKIYNDGCNFKRISVCLSQIVKRNDYEELDRFFNIIREHETKNIVNNKPIKKTLFFINNLELFDVPNDINLAIFSLNTNEAIETSLKQINLYDKFDYIVGREDVTKWKPKPEGLLLIKEHFKCNRDQMIYFGDLQKDLETGANAGIESHLVDELLELVNSKKNK